ncbi:DUF4249 domain-containing protein [Bacteroidota bacterium]
MVSCIELYQPEIKEMQEMLVINGSISDQPGWHYVEVSRSSPYNEPGFIPVEGCVVRVEDENGLSVTYADYKPGVYRADLDASFLGVNKAYKLYVYTQEGKEYQSDYDSLLACPPIDSLYYETDRQAMEDSKITYPGIQFYVDVKGKAGESRDFLWKMEESYEYHSKYDIQFIWNGEEVEEFDPPIDSLHRCYRTRSISEIYAASSRYLVTNELNRYPLNFVSGNTPKLKIKYSLMVTQHSLSNDAFLYWDNIRKLIGETGGLYEKQPANTKGNIHNVNDAEEQILGFFYASQEREKWIILKNQFDFAIQDYSCPIDTVEDLWDFPGDLYIISLNINEEGERRGEPYGTSYRGCFDCRLRGGTLEPPYYWLTDE